jgi:hypothetical protein
MRFSLLPLLRWWPRTPSAPDSNEAPHDPYSAPHDPYGYVRHPLVHRPGGRNAAIALEEPDEEQTLVLVGR